MWQQEICYEKNKYFFLFFEIKIILDNIYRGPWLPTASAVAKIPKTRNGWALAWYFTSFATGSGKKNLNWKKTCGAINPNKTSAYVVSPM